jgi:hypothetical protein
LWSDSRISGLGSNATFELFPQWPEQRRQRAFPAYVECVTMTLSGGRHLRAAKLVDMTILLVLVA